jgi:hypothetical protein
MSHRAAGLIYGPLEHHLDHLAPFCSLMQIPLILTDEVFLKKAQLYYPDLELLYSESLEDPFEVVRAFEAIFYSTPCCMFDEVFFIAEASLRKKMKTIWLPHSNSDKGHASVFMKGLKVFQPCINLGNFQLEYYCRHRRFYDSLIIQKLTLPSKKIALYAPARQDGENSTSFFEAAHRLIDQLPSDILLLIKLHPNLEKDICVLQFILQNETHYHIRFLSGFTPLYPVLEKADLYLGDMSSVSYEFLTFNRPMFFFNPTHRDPIDRGLYLHQCGQTLHPDQIFHIFAHDQSYLTPVRQETYAYTFGEDRNWDLIQQRSSNTQGKAA